MKLRNLVLLMVALVAPLLMGQDKPAAKSQPKGKAVATAKKKTGQRQTPFGSSKVNEESAGVKPEEAPENLRAFEEGDSVRFERPTPFGTMRWVRKKTDLTGVERAAWERERRAATEAQSPKQ
jgi:hypothetical protein